MTTPSPLRSEVAALLADAEDRIGLDGVGDLRRALDEPLTVAIAGKVKAGKSTLLNALIGMRIAPTGTGETTRIVTWYRHGPRYEIHAELHDGSRRRLPFERTASELEIDLDGLDANDIRRLDVAWPTPSLVDLTLIDTPGVDSINDDVSARTRRFLTEEDRTTVDAVVYLLRHTHETDLRLLEAFHDDSINRPDPVNTIAVLSRSDEIAGGRLDSMASARRISRRYTDRGELRRLVQAVVPVAGLLGETARTLTQAEFDDLGRLAEVPARDVERSLLSVDRFVAADPTVVDAAARAELLRRFGLFGVKLSTNLVRRGVADSAEAIAEVLADRSGLTELRDVLDRLLRSRADVLKARTAILGLERLLGELPSGTHPDLAERVDRVLGNAHPLRELAALASLRARNDDGPLATSIERAIGGHGTSVGQRLGCGEDTSADERRNAAWADLALFHDQRENPFTDASMKELCDVAVRSLEIVLADLELAGA